MKLVQNSYSPITLPTFLMLGALGLMLFVYLGIDSLSKSTFIVSALLIVVTLFFIGRGLTKLCNWKVKNSVVIISTRNFKNLVMPKNKVDRKQLFKLGRLTFTSLIVNFDGEKMHLYSLVKG